MVYKANILIVEVDNFKAISFFKDVTKLTGVKKALNYYISYNKKPNENLNALSEKFDKLLKNKLLLSAQERKILKSVMDGETSKNIALDLFIIYLFLKQQLTCIDKTL